MTAGCKNDGNRSFTAMPDISNSCSGALSPIAVDFDKDGDLDVAVACAEIARIVWFQNANGRGTFAAKSSTIVSNNLLGVYSLSAADLDNDGDMDLASASVNDDKISWLRNSLIA